MSELEKKLLIAIEGHEQREICEALLLMLHRELGATNYASFLRNHALFCKD
jgi:hypothetical protein